MPITISNPAPSTPTTTHIALLIDSSGSMGGMSDRVVTNVNNILADLQTKAKELGQKVLVSLYGFGGGQVQNLFLNRPIEQTPRLRTTDYVPTGDTPMYDAIGTAIANLRTMDAPHVANLVTVITDGEENSSRSYNLTSVSGLIESMTKTDRWTFSAMVPRNNSLRRMLPAIPAGNVQEWDTTREGLDIGTKQLGSSYAGYLNLRSTGATKSTGFFTAGVNAQQAKAIKKKLEDVRDEFKEMTVRTQDPKVLQDFVEARGLRFMKGRAFYQLTKAEKVQPHKEVLMRDIKTGAIYGGKEARDILGLPPFVEVKVKPEDHGDWDIFVQSTSNNRKLVPGTNVLYLK